MQATDLLLHAQRLQAIAQAGLTWATNAYDLERYAGYQTPKVDVRAVVFRGENEILMVREKVDHNRWTVPGGWADVGYTPTEVAVKEVREEAGLVVKPGRLLALLDKRKHLHPAQPWYVYKIFIRCELVGGDMVHDTTETAGAGWFHQEEAAMLELSTDRLTTGQLDMLFQFAANPEMAVRCD